MTPDDAVPIPEGWRRHDRRSPLTDPWEPLFARPGARAVQLGLHIREAHCNSRGVAHGGLISSLADNAMGLSAVHVARGQPGHEQATGVTVSLTLDFLDAAKLGEFLEFSPTVLKVGGSLAFVDCHVTSGGRMIARASASFRIVKPAA